MTITLPSAVPANQSVTATVEYRLPVGDNTGLGGHFARRFTVPAAIDVVPDGQ